MSQIRVVGVPKELKEREYRVGLTPDAARAFVQQGLKVIIQTNAGVGAGFSDESYVDGGCELVDDTASVYNQADLIIKVKEPIAQEYALIRPDHTLFTFFHFAANHSMTTAMLNSGAVCIAYETITGPNRTLPILQPMSEIAGRMAVQQAAKFLEKQYGGSGTLLSGLPGVPRAKVLVLGGGAVGRNAAKVAAGMGAIVTILELDNEVMRQLDLTLPDNCQTLYSSRDNVLAELPKSDVVIGAVLLTGAVSPVLVTRNDLKLMKSGSVVIDVAVDQGGCIETCKPTTHDNPTYVVDGIVHYCVANMPGSVPKTASMALCNASLKYGLAIATMGWKAACKQYPNLIGGINVVNGSITCAQVAKAFGMPHVDISKFLDSN